MRERKTPEQVLADHREASRLSMKKIYDRRRAAKQCVRCEADSPEHAECSECRHDRRKIVVWS